MKDRCPKCKEGQVIGLPSIEKWCYKGELFMIDIKILIPTCDHCYAEYIGSDVSKQIDEDLEKQYQARVAELV